MSDDPSNALRSEADDFGPAATPEERALYERLAINVGLAWGLSTLLGFALLAVMFVLWWLS